MGVEGGYSEREWVEVQKGWEDTGERDVRVQQEGVGRSVEGVSAGEWVGGVAGSVGGDAAGRGRGDGGEMCVGGEGEYT